MVPITQFKLTLSKALKILLSIFGLTFFNSLISFFTSWRLLAPSSILQASVNLQAQFKKVKSFDLVEYNPINDIDNKTLDIAIQILNTLIKEND